MQILRLFFVPIVLFASGCVTNNYQLASPRQPIRPPLNMRPFYPIKHILVKEPGCEGEHCKRFLANWPIIKEEPGVSAWTERQLIAIVASTDINAGCGKPGATLQDMADHYFESTNPPQSCSLLANVSMIAGSVYVIDVTVFGANHPYSHSYNYDTGSQRVLTLDDILVPGSRDQLYAIMNRGLHAGKGWTAVCNRIVPGSGDTCTFPPTDDFKFANGGISLVYNEPNPEKKGSLSSLAFLVTYESLTGIIKPEWVLQSGDQSQ